MAGAVPLISAIAPIFGTLLAPDPPSPPQPAPPPPPPAPAPAPEPPTVSTAPEVAGEEPVVDAEAARVRAQKRRAAREDQQLFELQQEDDESVVLTKSLLGD